MSVHVSRRPIEENRIIRVWWRQRAPMVLLVAVVAAILVVVVPDDFWTKVRAAVFVIVVALIGSFVRVPKQGSTGKTAAADAVKRAVDELPAIAKIDMTRPLLAVERGGARAGQVYLIVLPAEGDQTREFVIVPAAMRGRGRLGAEGFESAAALQGQLKVRDIGVIPQSDFSDRLGAELFGSDWRDS